MDTPKEWLPTVDDLTRRVTLPQDDLDLRVAVALARHHKGSPWYEDRIGDAALAMTEANHTFDAQDGRDNMFYRANHAWSWGAGMLRQRAREESVLDKLEQSITDAIGDNDMEWEIWAERYMAQTNPELDSPFLRTVDGIWLTYEQAAEIICKLAGDNDSMHYQELLTNLLEFGDETDFDFTIADATATPVPETVQVVTKRAPLKEVNGRFQFADWQEEIVEAVAPNYHVWGEEEEERFDPLFEERAARDERGDPAQDVIDPEPMVTPWASRMQKALRQSDALSQVPVHFEAYDRPFVWTRAGCWRYWYNTMRHTGPANEFQQALAAAWQPSEHDLELMALADEALATVTRHFTYEELDYHARRAIVVEAASQMQAHGMDFAQSYGFVAYVLALESSGTADITEIVDDVSPILEDLRQQVLRGEMWPEQAVKLICLLDGLSPAQASDWQKLVYNHLQTIRQNLHVLHIPPATAIRLVSTIYPGLCYPKEHRVFVWGNVKPESVIRKLQAMGAVPSKVELIAYGKLADELEALQSGFTVVRFDAPDIRRDGPLRRALEAGMSAAYATRCWIWMKQDGSYKIRQLANQFCNQVYTY